jgi:hypothetical protein
MSSIVSGITPNGSVVGDGLVGFDKVRANYFERLDAEVPSELLAGYTAVNAVHTISRDEDVAGGNYTLTITIAADPAKNRLVNQTFTTANIAHNANAATIQTAINSAATSAGVIGWTNGHIVVTGGALAAANIVLTFSGASVSGTKHPVSSATNVSLVDGDTAATGPLVVTLTTAGQKALGAVQLLLTRGPMNGTDPLDPSTWTRNTNVKSPVRTVLDAYAWLINDELQSQTAGDTILTAFGY